MNSVSSVDRRGSLLKHEGGRRNCSDEGIVVTLSRVPCVMDRSS